MAFDLLRGEEVLWKSHPGKKYRNYVFLRDLLLAALFVGIIHYMFKEIETELFSETWFLYIQLFIGGLGLSLAIIRQLGFLFIQYTITTDRVLITRGFLNKKLTSVKHEHIDETKQINSFFERMLSTGNIYIFTANDGNVSENDSNPLNKVPCFRSIDNPRSVHRILHQAMEDNANTH
ncbi:PH domain-containing protein (plasmid) [Pontibacillus sp. ALD_SL1]|uniref:PH domain-containing protein n=1 Tax=Pontibacillus sp. ALD_SL1 TaxID=2777185 RepID=UPI001A95AFE5|nr:PH domain-containing protein [Pontibacillus sp. ALD_SL1]QST02354.1 PH domain-containing protein [Pontibacillus sp. ALD_SL1]